MQAAARLDAMTGIAAPLLLGALAGFALGVGFYVALWATIRRATRAARPWTWMLGSFALRLAVVGAGFLLLARIGTWQLAGALAGFVAARPLVTRALLAPEEPDEPVA